MSAPRFALVAVLAVAPAAVGQVELDRPAVLDDKPATKADQDRKKANDLLREAKTQFGIGVLQKRQDRLLEALKALEKAATLDPESTEVRKALVPLYVMFARESEAVAACRHVLDRDPFDAETAIACARLLRADGRPGEAAAILRKATAGKAVQARPDKLVFLLSDLYYVLDKAGDHAGAAAAQDSLVKTITEHREELLYGGTLSRDELGLMLAKSYERLGQAAVALKDHDRATAAFRNARDTLLKSDDPAVRQQAVRINWNLAEMAVAQARWADALEALETYLAHGPAELEPYDRLVTVLGKLGRDRDVVPALRKYAAREEFNLNVQLLLARELAKRPDTRPEAERLYDRLLAKNIKPEIYRGLFRLYRDEGQMDRVLDTFDAAIKTAGASGESVTPDAKDAAKERGRVMLAVLRSDRDLVKALLPEARVEATADRKRERDTWRLLGHLAAHTRQLDDAEKYFRQALLSAGQDQEFAIYSGLIDVLRMKRRPTEVVKLCRDTLSRKHVNPGLELLLRPALALALSDLGEHAEAVTHIDRAIETTNDDLKVRRRCDKIHILTAAARYGEAEKLAFDTLKEFTGPVQVQAVRYSLSNVYSKSGDHAKSEAQLRLILEVDPESALANNNLGYGMADRNVNLDEAERLIRKALAADQALRKDVDDEGENAAYLDSLGWVLFRKGQFAEARTWLEKAAALPDGAGDPTVWDHLGDACARGDDVPAARKAWRRAVELYDTPGHKDERRKAEVEKKLKDVR
ncbi:MAG TPA: hypothetical protein VM597_28195 [Gemmataceae bacterium]|nr:hypothetical protein [Gemmataceae bacterium]